MKTEDDDAEEFVFRHTVDRLVALSIWSGSNDFGSLVSSLPGVYPVDVLNSIRRQSIELKMTSGALPRMSNVNLLERTLLYLPVPHPLDFDWRFSAEAGLRILDVCREVAGEAEHMVLLGTPSLLPVVRARGLRSHVTFLDSNDATIDCLGPLYPEVRMVKCALGSDPVPDLCSTVVIADPPWYPEYMADFIQASAVVLKLGGLLLLSCPPAGTRPGISREMCDLLSAAEALGLDLVRAIPSMLPYTSPLFEVNALSAASVPTVPRDWRRGDLAVFRLARESSLPRALTRVNSSDQWKEVTVYGVRIRVKTEREGDDMKSPALVSVVPGDILPTVSRRDPRRRLVSVWTSGNRVFGCQNPAGLLRELRTLVCGTERIGVDHARGRCHGHFDSVNGQLTNLISAERAEIARWREQADAAVDSAST
jgi:hypothetical protein